MDKVVQKAVSSEEQKSTTQSPSSALSSSKPCRYGDSCSRPGCRFRHSFDNVSLSNNLYCSNNWLPHSISLTLKGEQLIVEKIEKDDNKKETDISTENKTQESQSQAEQKKDYELTAVVCYINEPSPSDKKNVIALIKVQESYLPSGSKDKEEKWFLFNDFSICSVPAKEAVWFSLDWKVPCVLYYSSPEVRNSKTEVIGSLTKDVFTQDACIARSGGTSGVTFTPLSENEMPQPGQLVAMDAEFVTLNQEEAELRSDGKMSTIKPSQMSVARITCIRG